MSVSYTKLESSYRFYILFAAVVIFALISGCTQPESPPQAPVAETRQQDLFQEVTATQPDASHIVVTYEGGTNMERIIELETSVTDSTGKTKVQSAGSRLATTPIPIKGTNTIEGDFSGSDHVVVIAYMTDGSRTTVLDTVL